LSGTAKFNHDRIVTGRSLALNFLGNDAHEFIPRFLIQVLPTGFHRIRREVRRLRTAAVGLNEIARRSVRGSRILNRGCASDG